MWRKRGVWMGPYGKAEVGRFRRNVCGASSWPYTVLTLRSSSTMSGALTDAMLPVVMRRLCVCPSRLLAAAVNFIMNEQEQSCYSDSSTPYSHKNQ